MSWEAAGHCLGISARPKLCGRNATYYRRAKGWDQHFKTARAKRTSRAKRGLLVLSLWCNRHSVRSEWYIESSKLFGVFCSQMGEDCLMFEKHNQSEELETDNQRLPDGIVRYCWWKDRGKPARRDLPLADLFLSPIYSLVEKILLGSCTFFGEVIAIML